MQFVKVICLYTSNDKLCCCLFNEGMVTRFCKELGWNCMEILIDQFQTRLQFGVSRELLDLLRLPMLNGLRARSLYKEGITSIAELAVAHELDVERALHKALPFERYIELYI